MTISQTIPTPVGEMLACATDDALCALEFIDEETRDAQIARIRSMFMSDLTSRRNAIIDRVEQELNAYFAGTLTKFSIPIDMEGTPFQHSVWNELLKIPYGETWSYATLTRRLGDMKAIRAVARTNGENRIAIIVPCHRVIGSDGSLRGNGNGFDMRKKLLDAERERV